MYAHSASLLADFEAAFGRTGAHASAATTTGDPHTWTRPAGDRRHIDDVFIPIGIKYTIDNIKYHHDAEFATYTTYHIPATATQRLQASPAPRAPQLFTRPLLQAARLLGAEFAQGFADNLDKISPNPWRTRMPCTRHALRQTPPQLLIHPPTG